MAALAGAAAGAAPLGAAVALAAAGAESVFTGTDVSSTGFAAHATRASSTGIQNSSLIRHKSFIFHAGAQ